MSKLATPEGFRSHLITKLLLGEKYIEIPANHLQQLLARMGEDTFTYLAICDPVNYEIVKATASCGGIVIERAQAGTTEANFPAGATVSHVVTYEGVRYLICNEECCTDCCDAVAYAGSDIPQGTVGVAWEGTVMFSGSLPIALVSNNTPAWMTVTMHTTHVKLSGIPTEEGAFTFAVAATNCYGKQAVETVTLTIVS